MSYFFRTARTLLGSVGRMLKTTGVLQTVRLLVMFFRILWHIGWTTRWKIIRAERLCAEIGASGSLRRTLLTELRAWSAIIVSDLIQNGFRVKWDRVFVDHIAAEEGPYIVVANHNNSAEIVVLMTLLAQAGMPNLKFVSKIGLGKAPIVGYLLSHCGDALIHRSSSMGDLDEIFERGQVARADNGSFAIFPEGTRFLGPTSGSPFTRVGSPKLGGFTQLVHAYPNTRIVAVCFNWTNLEPGQGRTMGDIGDYYRAHLRTTCRMFPPTNEQDAERALLNIFEWFECELVGGKSKTVLTYPKNQSTSSSGA